MTYLFQTLIDFLILFLLAEAMSLVLSGGLLLVSQAVAFGIGAYVAALLTLKSGCNFLLSTAAGAIASSLASLLVSLPAGRLRGDSFVMMSLAVQVVAYAMIYNAVDITGGPFGISGIPKPSFFGIKASARGEIVLLYGTIVFVITFALWVLMRSGFGRSLLAIREDEVSAKSLGIPILRLKMQALAISAAVAGVAGSLHAHQASYLDPTSFTLDSSLLILSACVVGGIASVIGPLVGVATLVLIQESLRLLDFPSSVAGALKLLLYGTILIWIILQKPQGLVGQQRIG